MGQSNTHLARLDRTANSLIANELTFIGNQFGHKFSGANQWLPFHNRWHTEEVLEAATTIGKTLGRAEVITAREAQLLRIAAVFHDHVQGQGSGRNEVLSAKASACEMLATGLFSNDDVRAVTGAIVATVISFGPDGCILQSVDRNDVLQGALADADLIAFGRPYGPQRALMLFAEMELAQQDRTVRNLKELREVSFNQDRLADFLAGQSSVYLNHSYFLGLLHASHDAQRTRNAAFSDELATKAQAGMEFAALFDTARQYARKEAAHTPQLTRML